MLTFDHAAHAYTLDGSAVPSVTGILKHAGLIRLDHIPRFIIERARVRGTDVHELLHYYNEGDLDWTSVDEQYRPYIEAWVGFVEQRQFRIDLCEYRIASRRHHVAGTLDCLGLLDGEGALVDFKTGDPDDVAANLQTAAYMGLAYEWAETDERLAAVLNGYRRLRRYSVRLRSNGAFAIDEYSDPAEYRDFLTLTAAYHIAVRRGALVSFEDLDATAA